VPSSYRRVRAAFLAIAAMGAQFLLVVPQALADPQARAQLNR
jgi:hypothetical protein